MEVLQLKELKLIALDFILLLIVKIFFYLLYFREVDMSKEKLIDMALNNKRHAEAGTMELADNIVEIPASNYFDKSVDSRKSVNCYTIICESPYICNYCAHKHISIRQKQFCMYKTVHGITLWAHRIAL